MTPAFADRLRDLLPAKYDPIEDKPVRGSEAGAPDATASDRCDHARPPKEPSNAFCSSDRTADRCASCWRNFAS